MLNQTDTIIRSWTKMSSLFFFSSLTSVKIVFFQSHPAVSSGVRQQRWDTFSRLHEAAAENTRDGTSGCCDERGRFLSEVLLPSFFGLDGVQDGLPLGLVTLPDLLDLLLHLRVQRGQTQTQLLHRPRAHLHTHIIFIQLWVLEILKKKQLTCYQAELS